MSKHTTKTFDPRALAYGYARKWLGAKPPKPRRRPVK